MQSYYQGPPPTSPPQSSSFLLAFLHLISHTSYKLTPLTFACTYLYSSVTLPEAPYRLDGRGLGNAPYYGQWR